MCEASADRAMQIKDLKREFVTELIYPAVQANCIYEVCRMHTLHRCISRSISHRMSTCLEPLLRVQSLRGE